MHAIAAAHAKSRERAIHPLDQLTSLLHGGADLLTQGLEISAALAVMRVLRTAANAKRTIVCTVHSAPADVFVRFDNLLLLQRGRQVYYGPPYSTDGGAVGHFKSLVRSSLQMGRGEVPTLHLLEVRTCDTSQCITLHPVRQPPVESPAGASSFLRA